MPETEDDPRSPVDANRVNRAFAGVGAALGLAAWFILFQLPGGLAAAIVGRSHPRLGELFSFLGMMLVAAGVVWMARNAWGKGWRRAFPVAPVSPGLLAWTLLVALCWLILLLVVAGILVRTVGLPRLPDPLAAGWYAVVIGAPLSEELLFRGYGLSRICELGGKTRALLLTSLVFGALHGSWIRFPVTFAVGLFLGWLVLRSGSLWPALAAHVALNGAAVAFHLAPVGFLSGMGQPSWGRIGLFAVLATTGMTLLWWPSLRSRISGLSSGA